MIFYWFYDNLQVINSFFVEQQFQKEALFCVITIVLGFLVLKITLFQINCAACGYIIHTK